MPSTRILDPIQNKIGTFLSAACDVPPGASSVTVSADLGAGEAGDPSNTLRLGIEADFGQGFRFMVWGSCWSGGAGAVAPSLSWPFNAGHPPLQVRGILENRTQVVAGLSASFH